MVEISRDGKRVYWTNSLYSTWDNQFYPDGVPTPLAPSTATIAPACSSRSTSRRTGARAP